MPEYIVIRYFREKLAKPIVMFPASYKELIKAMRRAEGKMQPVLVAFRDQVLFLKHNLNAQAISSLQGELGSIQSDVAVLIFDMEASIAKSQAFIEDMELLGGTS